MASLAARVGAWLCRAVPTREQLERNRLVRPLAQRAELWRFSRRSVPRGVAVGLFIGILAMIPGIQMVAAALLCVPCRGNIPIAAGMTFLSNPATTPLILAASLFVGNRLAFHADLSTFHHLYDEGAGIGAWSHWLVHDAGPALLLGLVTIALVAALTGYVAAALGWRWWIAHKRRTRVRRRIGQPA